ncbi:hypothetical protein ACFLZ6_00730 [Nanoarchaeota archaeon]
MNKTILATILIISLLMTGCAVKDTETCSDEIMNQDESDIDCGGSCSPCEDGLACETSDDCENKCSTNKKCYTPKTTTSSTTKTTPKQEAAELSEETRERVEGKLKPSIMSAFAISENFRNMDIGDSNTFGLGVINVYPQEYYFRVVVELKEAIDSYSNKYQKAEDGYVNAWLDKSEFTFTLGPQETKIWPIAVKVGEEMGKDAPTQPGSYTYNIKIYYGDDATLVSSIKDKYVDTKTLTIRVR